MPTPVRHPHRKPKTFGRTAIAAGVAALGLGGALLAAWLRRAPAKPAEHAAPDLAPARPPASRPRRPRAGGLPPRSHRGPDQGGI
ncbi:hypothetical protein [Sphingomonas sp. STIS6.2]|uniref:hypothetical protein n=1 Tax=Sphingomonas sp. STIS6.2 TaxID=1379700 RepID=UPI00131E78CE|nr:hypothetical protein [Sphingomonas sp. STIS6.2]